MPPTSVLIVDDNADARAMMQRVLQLAGYHTRTAANGLEAQALQRELPADVLITDIFMPEGDGFETIASFRKEYPGTKIVVVSGGTPRVRRDFLPDAHLAGAHATMQKPIDPKELLELLASLREDRRT